ncbi:MAG: GumC family protein [Hyphomicrobiaceae bacterium]
MKISDAASDSLAGPLASEQQTLADAIDVLRKHAPLILSFFGTAVAIALAIVLATPPSFTAETQLLIERRASRDPNANVNAALEQGLFESQMALMASEGLLLKVIHSEHLLDDPDLTHGLPANADADPNRKTFAVLNAFQQRLNVRRMGASYGVAISFRASDPKTAARVANAVAQAYLQDQIDTNAALLARDNKWLEDRLEELRTRVADATLKLKEFRPHQQLGIAPGQPAPPSAGQPTLDELDSRATALRKIYEGYIQSYYANLNQQAIPQLTARVVSPALPPVRKSHPQTTMIVGISGLIGMVFGLAAAALRETLSSPVRHEGQIRRLAEPLGRLPRRRPPTLEMLASPRSWFGRGDVSSKHMLRYTTALRQLRNAVPIGGAGGNVLAITSPRSGEGRTTIVYGLAETFAEDGLTTVLIDACIEDPRITKDARAGGTGLSDILLGTSDIKSSLLPHPCKQADVIPIGLSTRQLRSLTGPSAGDAWAGLIAQLKNSYDRVLIDLSVPSAERLAAHTGLENIVVVAEYGRTPREAVSDTVNYFESRSLPVAGILINKTPAQS